MNKRVVDWYCVNCNTVLGEVLGGEFQPSKNLTGELIQTRGPNLVVTCPDCGAQKVWYTADPIVRAMYQLVDAIVSTSATRMVHAVGRKLHEASVQSKDIGDFTKTAK